MPHDFTDDEKAEVSEYLAEKADLEERRRELLQELEEIEARLVETDVKYSAFYNARNPVLSLPVEVICLIFTFAQLPRSRSVSQREGETSEWREESRDGDEGERGEEEEEKKGDGEYADPEVVAQAVETEIPVEIVVSHVCRRWRSISLGCPTLWTKFSYETKDSNVDVRQALQRFDIYLERSAALPLRIWFNFEPAWASNPGNAQLVEKALDHAHRWQRFTMYSNDVTVMDPFYLLQDISVPMLEYLTLVPGGDAPEDVLDSYSTITSMDPRVLKGGAPKLTYLMLGGLAVYSLPPLSNITILRIEQPLRPLPVFELAPFLELLSLPSLNRLSLCGNIIEPFDATHTIHMPNLTSFRASELDATWDLLASIRAPQLYTLVIHMPYGTRFHTIPIRHLLDTGYIFPALNTLYFLGLEFGPEIVPALPRMTSQATHVTLSYENFQTILGCFSGVAWPRLKTLTCNIESVATIDDFVKFVKNYPKDSITFRILPGHQSRFDAELEALRMVSSVVGEDWQVGELFWPHDVDRFGPNYNSEDDLFHTNEIYY